MRLVIRRYAIVALLVVGSATLLYSCGSDVKPTTYDLETLMTESSENRTITMIEDGYRSYIFYAPLVEGYSMRKEPYQEFRRGIKMTTFTPDTLELVNAIITANYAIYYETQRLWEAKGDVVIHKFNRNDGDTTVRDVTEVYTQQLFWNATTKKIYSNVDTKVLQGDGWHFGVGFDADEDLKNIHFRKYSSEVEFEMSQTKKSADTLSGDGVKDEPQTAPAPISSPSRNATDNPKTSDKAIGDLRATNVEAKPSMRSSLTPATPQTIPADNVPSKIVAPEEVNSRVMATDKMELRTVSPR